MPENSSVVSRDSRLCIADERYLEWYEMYSALPHMHVQKLFTLYLKKKKQYMKKLGKDEITAPEVSQCFFDAATEIANAQAMRKYQSVMARADEDD